MTTNVAAPFATRRRFTTRRPHADNTATIRKWHLFGRKRHKKTLCATRVTNTASITRNTPCVSFTKKTKWQRTSPFGLAPRVSCQTYPHTDKIMREPPWLCEMQQHTPIPTQTHYCLDRFAKHARHQETIYPECHLSVVRVSVSSESHLGVTQVPPSAI